MNDVLLNYNEAAKRMKVSRGAIEDRVRKGLLGQRFVTASGKVTGYRISEQDCDNFVPGPQGRPNKSK